MSLIVGRVDRGRVILLGDTQLTYASRELNPYLEGCLKLYIVNPKLAFGFAGIVNHFERALPELLGSDNASDLIQKALELKKKHSFDFDIIAAQSGENDLYVLKDLNISKSRVAHIGDTHAFSIYQQAYVHPEGSLPAEPDRAYISIALQPEPIWDENIYSRMTTAFKTVISRSDIKSVGGILVPLCTHKSNFQYMTYVDAMSDPFEVTKVINSGKPIDFGTAEYGSFSIELSDTSPHGGNCRDIGFYFLQGNFGVIFPMNELQLRTPKIVKAENPAFWTLNTSKEYGSGVASGYMTPDHCGLAGEYLMQNQNWKDALFCYELGKNAKGLKERPAVFDRFMSGYSTSMFNSGKQTEAIALLESLLQENPSLPLCGEYLYKFKQALL